MQLYSGLRAVLFVGQILKTAEGIGLHLLKSYNFPTSAATEEREMLPRVKLFCSLFMLFASQSALAVSYPLPLKEVVWSAIR